MRILIFTLLFFSSLSHATVRVAFFRMYSSTGELLRLEPEGQFFHMAVQLADGQWLHSHPAKGVEIVPRLSAISSRAVVLTNEMWPSLTLADVQPYVGLPFDYRYNWSDSKSSYCAKLVANLLNIEPLPMTFADEHWKGSQQASLTGLGLSPDDLYRILGTMGFHPPVRKVTASSCESKLNGPFMRRLLEVK